MKYYALTQSYLWEKTTSSTDLNMSLHSFQVTNGQLENLTRPGKPEKDMLN